MKSQNIFKKPTGKLYFAYNTIAELESRIKELEAKLAKPVIAPELLQGVLLPEVPTEAILEAIVKEFVIQETHWMWQPKAMYHCILYTASKHIDKQGVG